MRWMLLCTLIVGFSSMSFANEEQDQTILNDCIGAWKNSPFKKGASADKEIVAGVKVFGIGKETLGDEAATSEPSLVLVRPAVNVLGKSTIRLMNPNGWYCLKANVNVLGKVNIEASCKAHIASAYNGAAVLAADDSNGGVSVLGSIRITKLGCKEN